MLFSYKLYNLFLLFNKILFGENCELVEKRDVDILNYSNVISKMIKDYQTVLLQVYQQFKTDYTYIRQRFYQSYHLSL